uniref:Uncharacterized protein n=1 Tax=Oryza nivara TaxID=4536 RepID=A0A0E0FRA2_ORYNI
MARAGSCAGWASSDGLASRLPLPPKLLRPAATDRDDDEEDDDEDTVLLGIVRHIPCAFDSANRLLSSSPAAVVALSDLLLSHRSRRTGRLLSFSPPPSLRQPALSPFYHRPCTTVGHLSPLCRRVHSRESGEKRKKKK